jgi:hypothetical protein
MPTISSVV